MKFLNDLQFQKNFLKQHRSYLKRGVYFLHGNLRTYISNEHKSNNWFPTVTYSIKTIIKVLIARVFYSVVVCSSKSEFGAQAVYFSNSHDTFNRDAKFFNYQEKVIKTVCPNKQRYDLYMNNRAYFEKYFPMVDLLLSDEKHLTFNEKMITKKSVSNNEWESVFRTIFNIYSSYYKIADIDKTSTVYHCTRFSSYGTERKDFSIVLYRQHGDLSSDNFIYDINGNIFFIDYDHANYYPIFYDLFFLMLNLYIWKCTDVGIKLLINGAFDDYFENASENSFTSTYDAFLLFSDYYLNVCTSNGLPYEWQVKYENILSDILKRLKR